MRTKKGAVSRRVSVAEREPEPSVSAVAVLPMILVALHLLEETGKDQIYIAADERRADEIGRVLRRLAPGRPIEVFPPWDCLPFDRASPSRDSMGRRASALLQISGTPDPKIVVTSVEAASQRIAPLDRLASATMTIADGDPFDLSRFRAFADRAGYGVTDRVSEPGDLDFHGQVVEIFVPGQPEPFRIEVKEERVAEIHTFDPLTQRSTGRVDRAVVGPATEMVPGQDEDAPERAGGAEHRLAAWYGTPLLSLFDLLPEAVIFAAPGTAERRAAFIDQVREAAEVRSMLGDAAAGLRPPKLDAASLYLDAAGWAAALASHEERDITDVRLEPVPAFASEAKPARAFQAFVEAELAAKRRVVLAGVPRDLAAFGRHLQRHGGRTPEPATDWNDVLASRPGSFRSLDLDLEEGAVDEAHGIALIAAADVLGTRAHHAAASPTHGPLLAAQSAPKIGDVVIHEDHGLGVLRALEAVAVDGATRHAVRIAYHDEASLLVPVEDLGKVWRYGSDPEAVSLDRLHTEAWSKRRIDIEKAVLATARHLVQLAEERQSVQAPKLVAPEKPLAQFAARFAYPLTPDQTRAIAAVTEDLASGHPMDRLVCGDVGFGKTEVALRAAAIALMAGKQVALAAPTTVLARQHLELFRKRFAGLGFEIAGLSRLEATSEAKRVKAGLADGSIRMVIGTHAIAGSAVSFADLGLLIIDEEQKFGAKLKSGLRALVSGGHTLTLTATPIPRTLQLALVGVQTVSVIATPPVRRRPVRTFVTTFDPAAVRIALMREHARGGQSFVIVPRIEAIESLRAQLEKLVPELNLAVAHGELPAEDVDRVMVDFSNGQADVLLATNIVESGLDVPRANTMLVWDAGRFGLAQLHQLRGRVGRGRAQGVAYLLEDPETPFGEAAKARLATLQSLDRLGAGFAISVRDLDLRGAGDLVGDEQAGHIRLIGLDLYQSLLSRAVRLAKGEKLDDAAPPELQVDLVGSIPDSFVAEPDLRLELYSRLSRLETRKGLRAFRAEIEDRFGEIPAEVDMLLALARLRVACRQLQAASLSVGPRAVALTMRPEGIAACRQLAESRPDVTLKGAKLVWSNAADENADPIARAEDLIELLDTAAESG